VKDRTFSSSESLSGSCWLRDFSNEYWGFGHNRVDWIRWPRYKCT